MWCVPHGKASALTGDDRAYLPNVAALKAGDCQRRLSPHSSSSGPYSRPSPVRRCEPFPRRGSPVRTQLPFSWSSFFLSYQSSRQQLKWRARWPGHSSVGTLVSLDESQAAPGALIDAGGYVTWAKDPEESAAPQAVVEG